MIVSSVTERMEATSSSKRSVTQPTTICFKNPKTGLISTIYNYEIVESFKVVVT